MQPQWKALTLALWITAIIPGISTPVFAGESSINKSRYQLLDARWQLNPAGQLELWFDPLNNGYPQYGETYTVILNDRAPKMCGDPDGTGRHIWFFTDALMIAVLPVRTERSPNVPTSQTRKDPPQ